MVKLGIISDIHNEVAGGNTVERVLGDVVGQLNDEFEPDYTVVLGDVIEDTGSKRTDIQLIRSVRDVVDEVNSPVRYMAGNHDPVSLATSELRTLFGNKTHGTARVGDDTLVFLDSSAPGINDPRGEVPPEQVTWFDETLRDADRAFVFVHHPIHYCDLSENYWFATTPERAFCGNKLALNEVMRDYDNVQLVFNGHIHETHVDTYDGIKRVSLNAFNKVRPETTVTGTHAEVTVGAGTATVRTFERCDPVTEFTVDI